VIRAELQRALKGLLGHDVPTGDAVRSDGDIIVGTPASSPLIAQLNWTNARAPLGREGYVIRTTRVGRHRAIAVASTSTVGALYGTFHLLRRDGDPGTKVPGYCGGLRSVLESVQ